MYIFKARCGVVDKMCNFWGWKKSTRGAKQDRAIYILEARCDVVGKMCYIERSGTELIEGHFCYPYLVTFICSFRLILFSFWSDCPGFEFGCVDEDLFVPT